MEAAETGHVVLSTLNTLSAQQTVERFLGAFPSDEQRSARGRLARVLRYVISQRLVPRKDDHGRTSVFEVLKAGSQAMETLLRSHEAVPALDNFAIDAQIEDLVRAGIVSPEIALTHAIDPRALAQRLGITKS